jgi:hypothetical protein
MMNLVSRARLLGLALALGPAIACGSGSYVGQQEPAASDSKTGSVGMELTLAGGITVSTINYSISGPTSLMGSVNVGGALSVKFSVGALAPGSYTITITATDSNGDSCTGKGTFTITAGAITGVSLSVVCTQVTDAIAPADVNTGTVFVDAGFSLEGGTPTACPGITGLTVTPAELPVGSSSAINVSTVGPAPSIQWTATDAMGQTGAGTFANPTAASTTFTCTQAGQVVLTASVGSGACAGAPFTTLSENVTCDPNADAGSVDSSTVDSGSDSSTTTDASDASTSPCAANNGGAGCTQTEQLFVNHDPTCYACLIGGGCLDDTVFGDVNHECGDLPAAQQAACISVINCILGSGCASAAVSTCYCGTAGVATACQGNPAPGPINGVCATQIAAGLGFPVTDGTDNTKQLTNNMLPGGMADQIFQCAQSNACATCLK